MKKELLTGLFALSALAVGAQTFTEWQDPEVNAVNRYPMHTNYFAYESLESAQVGQKKLSANYMTLNGLWKFNWVANADARPTDFWKAGFNDKAWDNMPVPGIWEMHGYGDPIYVNTGFAWRNQFENNPPQVPVEGNHVGSYRREITVPASWKGKDIIAHFGAVASNMYLWVNGRYVGYNEDSKLEAEFDLTRYLKPGQKNLIAFQVFRWCDGSYLEDQDFFRHTGVSRDCYLYARGKKHIADLRATPDLDAQYRDGRLDVSLTTEGSGLVDLVLADAEGRTVASQTLKASGRTQASLEVQAPHKWSAETPYLYTLTATLRDGDRTLEVIPVKVGFRKIELKNAQVLVNGQFYHIKKGMVCFHSPLISIYELSRDDAYEELSISDDIEVFYPVFKAFYDLIIGLSLPNKPCILLDEKHINLFRQRCSLIESEKREFPTLQDKGEKLLSRHIIQLLERETILEFLRFFWKSRAVKFEPAKKKETITFRFIYSLLVHCKTQRHPHHQRTDRQDTSPMDC